MVGGQSHAQWQNKKRTGTDSQKTPSFWRTMEQGIQGEVAPSKTNTLVEQSNAHSASDASPIISYALPGVALPRPPPIHLYGKPFRQVESESHDANQTGRTPTGLALWPAGKLVSDFLVCGDNPSNNDNDNGETTKATNAVVELGCGLGLCGLVSHTLLKQQQKQQQQQQKQRERASTTSKAPLVVLTDSDAETLHFARRNCVKNDCNHQSVKLELLDWCSERDIQRVKSLSGTLGYSRVLASDVIYEATAPLLANLFYAAKTLLSQGGIFVLGIRRRTTSLQEVHEKAAATGLEGGRFVSEFLLDIFDNRLEGDCVDIDEDKEEGASDDDDTDDASMLWAQAILVFWHKNDSIGKEAASSICRQATERAEEGWLD